MSRHSAVWLLAVALVVPACTLPEETAEGGPAPAPARAPAPGEWVVESDGVGAIQLHRTGEEASLPVLTLGGPETLTLSFDLVGEEVGPPLVVSFVRTDRLGRSGLLPTEYLTGFEEDQVLSEGRSGAAVAVPYVHYRYTFPNSQVGFRLSGNYRARVAETDGTVLFEVPFYLSEELADVELGFGSTLQGGSTGLSIQPAARVRPDPRLSDVDASRLTVCFARSGLLDGLRCAPEPSLVDLALFQFYLPREAAFEPAPPLFEVDLGLLVPTDQVIDVDRAARPPTATLDLDYAEFGGDVRDAVLAAVPLVGTVYRDVGAAATDAQYVAVRFRYVPPNGRQIPRRVFVRGSFNGWRATAASELDWAEAEGRYEGEVLVKQGRYVYAYTPTPDRAVALGPTLFTSFVYFSDPRLFTDRLVAVRSAVAQ
jgi:hypothetical protein